MCAYVMYLHTDDLVNHPSLRRLEERTNLNHSCGYVTLLQSGLPSEVKKKQRKASKAVQPLKKEPMAESEGNPEIAEFLDDLKELGIGDLDSPGVREDTSINTGKMPGETIDGDGPTSSSTQQGREESPAVELTPSEAALEEEWVVLEMFYGIPLFCEEANKAVCEKVCAQCVPSAILDACDFQYRTVCTYSRTCLVHTAHT